MPFHRILPLLLISTPLFQFSTAQGNDSKKIIVYSARKEELIKPIFDQFTKETGLEVQFLSDDSPKLMARLESEGTSSPADLLITVDVANLTVAKDKGFFQSIDSKVLNKNIPTQYRDKDQQWFGLSRRVRAIFYNKDKVKPSELSTYEDLAHPRWKGEILVRSSSHSYNQSLLANIVAVHGPEAAQKWTEGFVANFARKPQGGDSDQIKAVAAGEAKLAIANSYYFGRMLDSDLPEDQRVKERVGIFFPNQKTKSKNELSGVHINISGAGILKTSKNQKNALRLLEYLSGSKAQSLYAEINKEYPIDPRGASTPTLKSWGAFKSDKTALSTWAPFSKEATRISDKAGWK